MIDDLGPLAWAGTVAEAAQADIVVLATYYTVAPGVLDALPNWNGRILIDTSNLLDLLGGRVVPVDIGDQSSSEIIAAHAPGARVVKAFNTLYAEYVAAEPSHEAGRQVVFYAGDDLDAKATVGSLLNEFGFAAVDLGSLGDGGRLMRFGPVTWRTIPAVTSTVHTFAAAVITSRRPCRSRVRRHGSDVVGYPSVRVSLFAPREVHQLAATGGGLY